MRTQSSNTQLADNVREDANQIDSAIFYSISSTQKGLYSFKTMKTMDFINFSFLLFSTFFYQFLTIFVGLHGIELGNTLIKRVVREIRSEFPQISQFSSLSPIPNFCEYLLLEIQAIQKGDINKERTFVTQQELMSLKNHIFGDGDHTNSNDIWPILMRLLKTNSWVNDNKLTKLLHVPLMRKCAHYLYCEKRRGYALNSVG